MEGRKNILKKLFTQKINTPSNMEILEEKSKEEELITHSNTDNKKQKIKQKALFKVSSTIQEDRKDIYESKSIKEQINLCYNLIIKNRKELKVLLEEKKLLNPTVDEESFKYYLNYFYNY